MQTGHNKRNTQKRRRRRTKKRIKISKIGWVLLGVVSIAIVGSLGYATYAKYFSESAKSGIAIATGIYFTANYAVQTDSNVYFESVVNSGYTGGTYNFDFEVRNFENNLLFNESSVTIPYSVSFWLGAKPTNAYYTVKKGDGSAKEIGVLEENKVTLSGQSIAGGAAITDAYTISINVTGGEGAHTAVPIYVEVLTDEGAIITKKLCGKMVFNNVESPESFIEEQQFVLQDFSGTDEEKYTELQKQSEFMYEIRTVGEVLGTETTDKLKLSWDPTVFEVDVFDEAYLEWLDDSEKSAPETDESGWNYFLLEVMPYSFETIGFFRGDAYADKVSDLKTMHQYIIAEKYTEE